MIEGINSQLEEMGLKIKEAKEAIVDAIIVRSKARPNRKHKKARRLLNSSKRRIKRLRGKMAKRKGKK